MLGTKLTHLKYYRPFWQIEQMLIIKFVRSNGLSVGKPWQIVNFLKLQGVFFQV